MKILGITFSTLIVVASSLGQQAQPADSMKDCPMHAQHVDHQATVESHGDQAMGFPHEKTTHHFRLLKDGGAIEVSANETSDKANTAAIQSHLKQIAKMFTDGDFSTPMFIHDGVPPGTETMKLMNTAIRYSYEEGPAGGRVRVKTEDAVALSAIHDFLRFQIKEHHTGDPLEVSQY